VLDGFTYPGHATNRMHMVPEKTGEGLMTRLQTAAAHVPIATQAQVDALYMDGDTVRGVRILRPDGAQEDLGCRKLILACNGYGGNRALVAQHIPEMREALYFGHPGNQGEAVIWGEAIGARLQDLTGYQGHGSVAHPHGVLITWALMMEGGVQVNAHGQRFANEHGGYSEASVDVLAQPGRVAYAIYDERLHALGMTFPDYQRAAEAGAVRSAPTVEGLAEVLKLPPQALAQTLSEITQMQAGTRNDPHGRDFTTHPALAAPYYAIKITGALFHTQGGLAVNQHAQVLHQNGTPYANLYAGGGAACGVSGPDVSGYLSGNGLLTAFALGAIAGRHAST
jgi:fumarate reductase flavoprotein subunit